jgi:hypothetical protein
VRYTAQLLVLAGAGNLASQVAAEVSELHSETVQEQERQAAEILDRWLAQEEVLAAVWEQQQELVGKGYANRRAGYSEE